MMAALLSLACWYFPISRIADRLGYDMGRGVMHLCWTCLETCLELPKSYIAIWWINSKVPEGSMITSGTVMQHMKVHAWLYQNHAWTLQVTLPARARFVTFLIVRPMYLMTDDSLCAQTFSNLETAAIQWWRPSLILQSVTYEFISTSPALTHMSGSSNLDSFRDGW